MQVKTVETKPIEGQKPGTSGLRKKTKVFMEPHYLNNFVQSVFDALVAEKVPIVGGTLVVSGGGFYNDVACQTIVRWQPQRASAACGAAPMACSRRPPYPPSSARAPAASPAGALRRLHPLSLAHPGWH